MRFSFVPMFIATFITVACSPAQLSDLAGDKRIDGADSSLNPRSVEIYFPMIPKDFLDGVTADVQAQKLNMFNLSVVPAKACAGAAPLIIEEPIPTSNRFTFELIPCAYQMRWQIGFRDGENGGVFEPLFDSRITTNISESSFYAGGGQRLTTYLFADSSVEQEKLITPKRFAAYKARNSNKFAAVYVEMYFKVDAFGTNPHFDAAQFVMAARGQNNQLVMANHNILYFSDEAARKLIQWLTVDSPYRYEINGAKNQQGQNYDDIHGDSDSTQVPWERIVELTEQAAVKAGTDGSLFMYHMGHANESFIPAYNRPTSAITEVIRKARERAGLGKLREIIFAFSGCYTGSGTHNTLAAAKDIADDVFAIGSTLSGQSGQVSDKVVMVNSLVSSWKKLYETKRDTATLAELYQMTNGMSVQEGANFAHGESHSSEAYWKKRLFLPN